MVSFFELFLPPVERARQIIEAGLIGEPFLFKAMMAWHTPDVTAGWRFDPELAGGGVILDGNVHHVSNALYLLGNPKIESVYAEYGALTADIKVEDTAVILVRTDKAILEISGSNRLQEPGGATLAFKDYWAVFGTKGTDQWDAAARPHSASSPAKTRRSIRCFPMDGCRRNCRSCRRTTASSPCTSVARRAHRVPSTSISSTPALTIRRCVATAGRT